MTNKFLYNKYLPLKESEIIGQTHIKKILNNLIIENKLPCNYIFHGKHGTGKTAYSKIFFNKINCKKDHIKKICNCTLNKSSIDFLEIDAASHRKVEEIKEFFKRRVFLPLTHTYRVICIDEAQMLSIYSFNYLLKIIENENKRLIIIFITTQFKKIPNTIKSRCLCLNFKKIKPNVLLKHLIYITLQEKVALKKTIIRIIAKNSQGSVRKALVQLELIIAYKAKTRKQAYKVLEIPTKKIVHLSIKKILNCSNINELLTFINTAINNIDNYTHYLKALIKKITKLITKNIITSKTTHNKKLKIIRNTLLTELQKHAYIPLTKINIYLGLLTSFIKVRTL
ncbi:AAA family ATPase [Candidatus Vidania fulgoroideae]|nr:AAA family ATPase [Candidatus Vidania fulgoroideae]